MISNKVMKVHEFNDAIFYRVACECGDEDCDLTLELEKDKDFDFIFLNMFKKLRWSSYWGRDKWYQKLWKRITGSMTLLFKGWVEVEEAFVFKDQEHIESFISALREGQEKMKAEVAE